MSNTTAYSGTFSSLNFNDVSTGAMGGPSQVGSAWLAVVERRIRDSIAADADKRPHDVRWLTEEVAGSALRFFRLTSDLLPSEPYIYGTDSGDLVAEFKSKHGALTSIVSGNMLLNYVVVDGMVQHEDPINLATVNAGALQEKLRPIMWLLIKGKNGSAMGS